MISDRASSHSCPACGSVAVTHYWHHVWQAPDKSVERCDTCGLYFLTPLPDTAEQCAFDANYSQYIRAREALVPPASGVNFAAAVDHSIALRFGDIGHHFNDVQSVLEIGAELGGFLQRLKGCVPVLAGVDSCPEYARALAQQGYEAYTYITDVPEARRYDRICMFSLLEHIVDPISFLQRAAAHLTPNGYLVIEVPHAREPLLGLYDVDAFKSFYFQRMHPFVYSLEALRAVLARAGLVIGDVAPKQRYGLANHLTWLRHGRPGGSPALAARFAGGADVAYIAALEAHGDTDTLYLTAAPAR